METKAKSTAEAIQLLYNTWIERIYSTLKPQFIYIHDAHNGRLMTDFINTECDGDFSYDNFTKALGNPQVWNHLHVRTKELTPEEKAAKAAAEHAKAVEEHNNSAYADFIKNQCPLGLLLNGILPPETEHKLIIYIHRNFPKVELVTVAMISEAVTSLHSSLDWYSQRPEDRTLRNQPMKERKLSEQAMIEAGMKTVKQPSHADTDGKFTDPTDLFKKVAKKLTRGVQDPYQTKCEGLSVTNRYGRIDHSFLAKLNQTFANNPDGSVHWQETFRIRNVACDSYERTRNRD